MLVFAVASIGAISNHEFHPSTLTFKKGSPLMVSIVHPEGTAPSNVLRSNKGSADNFPSPKTTTAVKRLNKLINLSC